MKSSSAHKTVGRVRSIKGTRASALRLVGAIAVTFVLIAMGVLIGMSFKGVSDDAPMLLIYGSEDQLPKTGFRYAVNSAGFEYAFVDSAESYSDGKLSIPSEYNDKDIVIMSIGISGFDHVVAFANDSRVIGFVLVCPDFPGNASMEGINSRSPDKDIAVFAGRDSVDSVSDVSGARLIYERISGDDTVFGSYVSTGGMFPSKVYISTEQNRYLSIAHFDYGDGDRMLVSPVFQKELADYLNTTYSDITGGDMDGSAITRWYSLGVMAIFLGAMAFCVYFMSFPRESVPGRKGGLSETLVPRKTYLRIAFGSLFSGMAAVILFLFSKTGPAAEYILLIAPLVVASTIMIMSIIHIGKADMTFTAEKIVSALFMTITMSLYVVMTYTIFGDLTVRPEYMAAVIAVAAAIDGIVSGLMAYERRYGGLMPGDTIRTVGIMCLPGILAFLSGLVTMDPSTCRIGAASLLAASLPPTVSLPVGRHSSSSLCLGIVHSLTYLMIMLALL